MNKQDLIDFENEVVERFNDGQILSPIHLSGGNEEEVIKVFKDVKPQDWVFTTYRSHYHALLKGVDKDWLMKWVLDNKSIHVMNKEHKIVTSAIVGGTLSQAVGCAMAIKMKGEDRKVWCFCGDMTASLGVFNDCYKYAMLNDLPITFIIEDNGLSTDTPTEEAWGGKVYFYGGKNVRYYKYKRTWPHYGTNVFVEKLWRDMKKDDVRAKGF